MAGNQRPDWDDYAFGIAQAVARRADCTRRRVGAVVLDVRRRVAGAGYNGSYPGGPSCLEGACPRGRHYWDGQLSGSSKVCACGAPWPCPEAVTPGTSYDTGTGACIATHAELNAVLDVSDRNRLVDATLYVTTEPCDACVRQLRNTSLATIKWPGGRVDFTTGDTQ